MSSWYEKNYWRSGFKSRLYDWLTPESYFESMRQSVGLFPKKEGLKVWDAGCGSGLLVVFLKEVFNRGMFYYGTDLLSSGLEQVKKRARAIAVSEQVVCVQSNLFGGPPFKENSIDVVVAHFSIYTIRDNDKRQQTLKNMCHVLKPGGLLIATCPSKLYDPRKILNESCELIRAKKEFLNAAIKRFIFYPFTKWMGLKFIQAQLKSGKWIGYTLEELKEELQQAGFEIGSSKKVYAEGAYLICGHKTG